MVHQPRTRVLLSQRAARTPAACPLAPQQRRSPGLSDWAHVHTSCASKRRLCGTSIRCSIRAASSAAPRGPISSSSDASATKPPCTRPSRNLPRTGAIRIVSPGGGCARGCGAWLIRFAPLGVPRHTAGRSHRVPRAADSKASPRYSSGRPRARPRRCKHHSQGTRALGCNCAGNAAPLMSVRAKARHTPAVYAHRRG